MTRISQILDMKARLGDVNESKKSATVKEVEEFIGRISNSSQVDVTFEGAGKSHAVFTPATSFDLKGTWISLLKLVGSENAKFEPTKETKEGKVSTCTFTLSDGSLKATRLLTKRGVKEFVASIELILK